MDVGCDLSASSLDSVKAGDEANGDPGNVRINDSNDGAMQVRALPARVHRTLVDLGCSDSPEFDWHTGDGADWQRTSPLPILLRMGVIEGADCHTELHGMASLDKAAWRVRLRPFEQAIIAARECWASMADDDA